MKSTTRTGATALRSLDKQERLLEELRTRTGVLLAASSIAASFLGQEAFRHPRPGALVAVALVSFVVSIGASVLVLMPKQEVVFAEAGTDVLEGLYPVHRDLGEVYRRLAYNLDHAWKVNDKAIVALSRLYSLATGALVVEILSLVVLLLDNIVSP